MKIAEFKKEGCHPGREKEVLDPGDEDEGIYEGNHWKEREEPRLRKLK